MTSSLFVLALACLMQQPADVPLHHCPDLSVHQLNLDVSGALTFVIKNRSGLSVALRRDVRAFQFWIIRGGKTIAASHARQGDQPQLDPSVWVVLSVDGEATYRVQGSITTKLGKRADLRNGDSLKLSYDVGWNIMDTEIEPASGLLVFAPKNPFGTFAIESYEWDWKLVSRDCHKRDGGKLAFCSPSAAAGLAGELWR